MVELKVDHKNKNIAILLTDLECELLKVIMSEKNPDLELTADFQVIDTGDLPQSAIVISVMAPSVEKSELRAIMDRQVEEGPKVPQNRVRRQ